MHSNDPTWLGTPGLIPGDSPDPYCCSRCGFGFDSSEPRFAGDYACHPCVRVGHCKPCLAAGREAWALKGWDTCLECAAAEYRADMAEFHADLHRLYRTAEGCAVIRAVLIPEGADAGQIAQLSVQQAKAGRADVAELLLREAIKARRVA